MRARTTGAALGAAAMVGLLSACGGSSASTRHATTTSSTTATSAARPTAAATSPHVIDQCLTAHQCLTPRTLRSAYGVSPLLARGIDGAGQTVVLPELALAPALAGKAGGGYEVFRSLAVFDARFHLPPVRLSVSRTLAPSADPRLDGSPEEQLDVEMVHALAPGAAIRVELVARDPVDSLPATLRAAVPQGDIVSMSFGGGERCFDTPLAQVQAPLRTAIDRHVTVIASAGDDGAAAKVCPGHPATGPGVGMPGSDPLITSVGGTALAVDPTTGAYERETVWNNQTADPGAPLGASGGGFSRLFPRPAYQDGVRGTRDTGRGVPDVAFDASPATGPVNVDVIDSGAECALQAKLRSEVRAKLRSGVRAKARSAPATGAATPGATASTPCTVIDAAGGTSVAAPAFAGIVALADQYAHRPLGFIDPALYQIGRGPHARQAFHDVITGDNTVTLADHRRIAGFPAGPGWDPVTGWGSPDARALVPLLARQVALEDGGRR